MQHYPDGVKEELVKILNEVKIQLVTGTKNDD
jgi:hypothetical protein